MDYRAVQKGELQMIQIKDLLNDNMKALLNTVVVEPEIRRPEVEERPYIQIYITPVKVQTPKNYSLNDYGWICPHSHATGCTVCPATHQSKTEDKSITEERCMRCVLRTRKENAYVR